MSALPSALVLSAAEAEEVRTLLSQVDAPRKADRHMAHARLRRLQYPAEASPTAADFEALVAAGEIVLDQTGVARISRKPADRVFKVSIGVQGDPVEPTWWAFNQRYQWVGYQPQQVAAGDHLFALAVDVWGTGGSAVVGLYEAVSPKAQRLPNSPNPARWPMALGVRPLAAFFPPEAKKVPGVYGPQNPVPTHVNNLEDQDGLYAAIQGSPPPPTPTSVAGRVQEVEWQDVGDDVVQAIYELGGGARFGPVLERAIEIGAWTAQELAVTAWFTGENNENSHIRTEVARAIGFEQSLRRRIQRNYGGGPYHVVGDYQPPDTGFGAKYRPASGDEPAEPDEAPHSFNLEALEKATARHMKLQDDLAAALLARGIEPRSHTASQPVFDLGFEHQGSRYVVEVKSGDPASSQQVRYGVGQVLEYAHLLSNADGDVTPVILIESVPPAPWPDLLAQLGVDLLLVSDLDATLGLLLS